MRVNCGFKKKSVFRFDFPFEVRLARTKLRNSSRRRGCFALLLGFPTSPWADGSSTRPYTIKCTYILCLNSMRPSKQVLLTPIEWIPGIHCKRTKDFTDASLVIFRMSTFCQAVAGDQSFALRFDLTCVEMYEKLSHLGGANAIRWHAWSGRENLLEINALRLYNLFVSDQAIIVIFLWPAKSCNSHSVFQTVGLQGVFHLELELAINSCISDDDRDEAIEALWFDFVGDADSHQIKYGGVPSFQHQIGSTISDLLQQLLFCVIVSLWFRTVNAVLFPRRVLLTSIQIVLHLPKVLYALWMLHVSIQPSVTLVNNAEKAHPVFSHVLLCVFVLFEPLLQCSRFVVHPHIISRIKLLRLGTAATDDGNILRGDRIMMQVPQLFGEMTLWIECVF
jgi:hypothetical protein